MARFFQLVGICSTATLILLALYVIFKTVPFLAAMILIILGVSIIATLLELI